MNYKKCHKRLWTSRITSCVRPALAGLFAAISACSLAPIAGSGTEEGNPGKVLGFVSDSLNRPVAGATVRLLPNDYDPVHNAPLPDSLSMLTDSNGIYRFSLSDTGHFTIYCIDPSNGTKALRNIFIAAGDSNVVHDTLLRPGCIKVVLPGSLDATNGYLYFPGTTIYSWLSGNNGYVILDSVPVKVYLSIYYAARNSAAAPSLIKDSVIALPGTTTTVAYTEWKYSKKLVLNTTSSGAGVANAVMNFPALIRFTSGNFDFGRAKNDGGDIRFTKSNGSPLPFEIERWDPVTELAEVWVKVDTVRGNDSSQAITMYWGNPTAVSESSGPAVFDSSSGFEGVWHLSETSGTLARDASHNGFTGTYKGGLPRGEPSPLGIGQNIARPDTDYIDIGNVLNPGMKNFALGAWIKRAALGTQQAFIAKTNGNAPSAAYGYLFNFDSDNLPHLYLATGSGNWAGDSTFDVKTDLAITDSTTWHYVFVVVDRSDNALCKMYLDGIDRTGHIGGNITHISAIVNALNLHIGTESDDNCSYSGSIGEATVAFTVRSADWVKLCYMNQKEQDALVKW